MSVKPHYEEAALIKGLFTVADPTKVPKGFCSDGENFDVTETGDVESRYGHENLLSLPSDSPLGKVFLFNPRTTGAPLTLIYFDGKDVSFRKSDNTWSLLGSFPASAPIVANGEMAYDRLYLVNGVDNVRHVRWAGSAFSLEVAGGATAGSAPSAPTLVSVGATPRATIPVNLDGSWGNLFCYNDQLDSVYSKHEGADVPLYRWRRVTNTWENLGGNFTGPTNIGNPKENLIWHRPDNNLMWWPVVIPGGGEPGVFARYVSNIDGAGLPVVSGRYDIANAGWFHTPSCSPVSSVIGNSVFALLWWSGISTWRLFRIVRQEPNRLNQDCQSGNINVGGFSALPSNWNYTWLHLIIPFASDQIYVLQRSPNDATCPHQVFQFNYNAVANTLTQTNVWDVTGSAFGALSANRNNKVFWQIGGTTNVAYIYETISARVLRFTPPNTFAWETNHVHTHLVGLCDLSPDESAILYRDNADQTQMFSDPFPP